MRLVEVFDADEAAWNAGIRDVVEFYEYCDDADHLTFEVLDGDLAGELVQASLDPIGAREATLAAATIERRDA